MFKWNEIGKKCGIRICLVSLSSMEHNNTSTEIDKKNSFFPRYFPFSNFPVVFIRIFFLFFIILSSLVRFGFRSTRRRWTAFVFYQFNVFISFFLRFYFVYKHFSLRLIKILHKNPFDRERTQLNGLNCFEDIFRNGAEII